MQEMNHFALSMLAMIAIITQNQTLAIFVIIDRTFQLISVWNEKISAALKNIRHITFVWFLMNELLKKYNFE